MYQKLSSTFRVLSAVVLAANIAGIVPAQALEFPDTGDRGAPSTTAGGGTRSGWCEDDDIARAQGHDTMLTALVPKNNVITFAGEQASVWMYGTAGINQQSAEIFIQHADTREVVYQEQVVIEGLEAGGLIRVDLPTVKPSGEALLAQDQMYSWEFAVICSSGDRALDYHINGMLQPVELDAKLTSQIETASPEEQAELYASAGIWQETLILAEQLSGSMPTLLPELLTSVGLEELSAALTPQAELNTASELR